MALRDLTQEDMQFFKEKNRRMITDHEELFLREINPDLARAVYRGYNTEKYREALRETPDKKRNDFLLTISRIFTAVNTIKTNLYYQNPRKLALPARGADPMSAALMTAVLNHYMHTLNQKEENQTAVMNAYFFGIGWKKIGWHTAFYPKDESPETRINEEEALQIRNRQIEPDNLEARDIPQTVRYETLFNTSENPVHVLLDEKGTWRSFKVLTHRLPRTLEDLVSFGSYDETELNEIRSKFKYQQGTRFSDRDIPLNLNEMMIEQRNGVWILTFIDEHDKPLKYEKSRNEGKIPWVPLVFTNEPDIRYPISHMKMARDVQIWIDRVAQLAIDKLDKSRSQIGIYKKALAQGQLNAIQQNKTGGIILFDQPLSAGVFADLSTKSVPADVFNMLALLQNNVTEIMGADEQRISGRSSNETLGQDELAAIGTQVREGGMLDSVRDWMIKQSGIEGQIIKQYSTSELHLKITSKDFVNHMNGKKIKDTWLEFGTTEQPFPLKQHLEGNFDYECNIYEAVKPDKKVQAKELDDAIIVYSNPDVRAAMQEDGVRVRISKLAQLRGKTFETIDIDDFTEELTPPQIAAMQVTEMLKNTRGASLVAPKSEPQPNKPNREPAGALV